MEPLDPQLDNPVELYKATMRPWFFLVGSIAFASICLNVYLIHAILLVIG